MAELPAPLVTTDVDLRDFTFMPLDVVRLRDSDMAAMPDAEVFRAAVMSWCVSWHQVPAGSLPDDDAVLSRLLGYGRDVKGWKKLRASGALRGFDKCSDGRLYHRVVAEKAAEAWKAKKAQRDRTKKARDARLSQPMSQNKTQSVTENVTDSSATTVTASKGQGQGQLRDREKETPSLRSGDAKPRPKPSKRSLPENFPDQDARKWAEEHWLAKGRADLCGAMDEEAAKFRDHHVSQAKTSADWPGSWRTWVRNAMNYTRAPRNGVHAVQPQKTFTTADLELDR